MFDIVDKIISLRNTLAPMHRTVDLEGVIIDCNSKYARMLGYTKDQVIGMSIFDHTPEEQAETIKKIFADWKEHIPIHNRRVQLMTKTGNTFDVLLTTTDVVVGGKLVRGRTTLLDYDEIRELQKAVKISKYESLYENSPDMYRTVNTDGIIIDCNIAYERKLGYTKSDIIGRNLAEHTAPRSVSNILINMARWRTTGDCVQTKVWLRKKDGTEFPTLVSPTNLYAEDGSLMGRNVIIQDMTEMEGTKEALARRNEISRMKDEFFSSITHELNTALTPIIGFSQAMAKPGMLGELNKRQSVAVNAIMSNSVRLRQIATDLLDIHKLELDKITFNYTEFSVPSLMKKVETSMAPMSKQKNVSVIMNVHEKGGVVSDEMRIIQILTNLIENAIAFTSKDTGKVTVSVKKDDGFLRFTVEDNGIGISDDGQAGLFKKFYQVKRSVGENRGTGLGLSICKGLTDGMGGKIWVRSKLGEGSTFYFTIPIGGNNADSAS